MKQVEGAIPPPHNRPAQEYKSSRSTTLHNGPQPTHIPSTLQGQDRNIPNMTKTKAEGVTMLLAVQSRVTTTMPDVTSYIKLITK